MAQDFNGTTSVITGTVSPAENLDWTAFMWVWFDGSGEGTFGHAFTIEDTSNVRVMRINCPAYVGLVFNQNYSTGTSAEAQSASGDTATGKWWCFVGTYTSSTQVVNIYRGDLATAMAELASYDHQTTGSGTRDVGGVNLKVGNRNAGDRTLDGRLAEVGLDERLWTLAEMEGFRQGTRPIQTGTLEFYYPLDSPDAAQAEDMSGSGAHGTPANTAEIEHPPVSFNWGWAAPIRVQRVVAAAAVKPKTLLSLGVG